MATSNLHPPVELVGQEPGQLRVYAWDSVRIIIWDATPTFRSVQTLRRVLEAHHKPGQPLSAAVVIKNPGLPLPDPVARDELVHAHRLLDATAFVIEHEGFVASSARAAITSVMINVGKRQSVGMTRSLSEAARWLVDARGPGASFDVERLTRALTAACDG